MTVLKLSLFLLGTFMISIFQDDATTKISFTELECVEGYSFLGVKVENLTDSRIDRNIRIDIMEKQSDELLSTFSFNTKLESLQTIEGTCEDVLGTTGLLVNLNNYGFKRDIHYITIN